SEELAVAGACAAVCRDEGSFRRELLDPVVGVVADPDVACAVDRGGDRRGELAAAGAARAELRGVAEMRGAGFWRGPGRDLVAFLVAEVELAGGRDRDPDGVAEFVFRPPCSPFGQEPPRRAELLHAVV